LGAETNDGEEEIDAGGIEPTVPQQPRKRGRLRDIQTSTMPERRQGNTAEGSGEEAEAATEDVSDSDAESDATDIFHVQVDPEKKWITPEDKKLHAARGLAERLRPKPLLPADPYDATLQRPWLDVASGVKLPTAHCAFKGCGWTGVRSDHIQTHLVRSHRQVITQCIAEATEGLSVEDDVTEEEEPEAAETEPSSAADEDLTETSVSFKRQVLAYYTAAIREKEREGVPSIGASIDRRTFEHVHEDYNSKTVRSLVCYVCATINTQTSSANSAIRLEDGSVLQCLSKESFEGNLCFDTFRERHMSELDSSLRGDADLAPTCWLWRQLLLRPNEAPAAMLCCPEDVVHCGAAHAAHAICGACRIPICRSCKRRMQQKESESCLVPMALANDNFQGFLPKLIYDLKVRWIEAAAACPHWTTQILYYIEGDRGHLLEEELFKPKFRTAVRGNIFSFHMPWEDIMASLARTVDDEELVTPQPPGVLCHLVKFHLRIASMDLAQHIQDMKLRSHVVLKLGYFFIEQGHPALQKQGLATARLKERYRKAVEKLYPVPAQEVDIREELREGEVLKEVRSVVEQSVQQRVKEGPLFDKNATPAEGAKQPGKVFEHVRPQAVLLERTNEAGAGGEQNAQRTAAFNQYSELQVQTGNDFVPQWNPGYASQVFPLTLPHQAGGPEFLDGQRRLRRKGPTDFAAAKVSIFQYVKAFGRRVEAQIQNSWDFLPGIRNLYHRWTILNTPGIRVKRPLAETAEDPKDAGTKEASATDLINAADDLYQKVGGGTYGDPQHPRPIAGDATKLKFAHNLSPTERELIRNMDFKAAHVPGTQQIRELMGHNMFGMRVVYGEGIFITVSPSERHNGLALRLLRYRQSDPALTADERWAEWKRLASGQSPKLEEPSEDEVVLDLPDYEFRRLLLARQPLSVVDAFNVTVRVVLARTLGLRMCPRCPHCNADRSGSPCQDEFGSNMLPMGGVLGGVEVLGGAVEHQRGGAPHFHLLGGVVSIYQHGTLLEIASRISEKLLDPEAVP
jgi:hypothetical protein